MFLSNIPTPYRAAFFETLFSKLKVTGGDLRVLYCASTEPNRNWPYVSEEHHYPHQILKGWHPHIGRIYPHINPGVRRYIKNWKPDILVAAGSWNTPTIMLAAFGPCPVYKHKSFWSEGHIDATQRKKGIVQLLRKLVYRQFGFFTVPNATSRFFIESYLDLKRPFVFLPNTVRDSFFRTIPEPDKSSLRKKYSLPEKARILIQVSQLEARKGVMELLEGYDRFRQRMPGASLCVVLVGTGTMAEALETRRQELGLENLFYLVGNKSVEEVKELYYACDVFGLCTKRDPNPLTPIEASFCGLPLALSSLSGNVDDLLIENKTGWRLNEVSETAIAGLLEKIESASAEDLKQMGRAALANVVDAFSLDQVTNNFIAQVTSRLDTC